MSRSREGIVFATVLFFLINFAHTSQAQVPSPEILSRQILCEVGDANGVTLRTFIHNIGNGTWEADNADKGYIYRQSRYDQLSRATHTQDLLFVPVDRYVLVFRMIQDGVELSASARVWWVYARLKEAQPNPAQPDDSIALDNEESSAISDQVQKCWTKAPSFEKLRVWLVVTLDKAGVARQAALAPESREQIGDTDFAVFAALAARAALEARCSDFSRLIPPRDLGSTVRLKFLFSQEVQPTPTQPDNSTKVQPNVTQNPAPVSTALANTMDKLDSMLAQTQPPKHRYNPPQGGAPKVGGALNGDITAQLTGEQRGAIGDQVRECWTKDARALEFEKLSVVLTVTLDPAGVARDAMVAPESEGRMGDPRFALLAARAVRASLEARCADFSHLIPARYLGSIVRLKFMFRP